jgi:hypothetical protein
MTYFGLVDKWLAGSAKSPQKEFLSFNSEKRYSIRSQTLNMSDSKSKRQQSKTNTYTPNLYNREPAINAWI